jgi:hypothetical protein
MVLVSLASLLAEREKKRWKTCEKAVHMDQFDHIRVVWAAFPGNITLIRSTPP